MSGIVPTLAGAIRRLKPEQVVELLCELTRGHEISLNLNVAPEAAAPEIPEGRILMPLRMTPAMIYAARNHSWTGMTYQQRLPKMWDDIVEASTRSAGTHG